MKLGELVKSLRVDKKVSQEQLAESTGLSKSYISEIESGIKNPRVEQILKISKALDVSLMTMFYLSIGKENNIENRVENQNPEGIKKELMLLYSDISRVVNSLKEQKVNCQISEPRRKKKKRVYLNNKREKIVLAC